MSCIFPQLFHWWSSVCFPWIKLNYVSFQMCSLLSLTFLCIFSHLCIPGTSPFRYYSKITSSTKYSLILSVRVLPLILFILYLKWLRQYCVCFSILLLWIVLENRIYKSWYSQRVSFNTSKNRFSIKIS